MRTGIFGGSFNPVHKGHIHLAENIKNELELDRIILVPSGNSPHRSMAEYADGKDRLEMLKLAAQGKEWLEVSDYELNADRISYSIYTVEHFRRKFPEDRLFLLLGSDMLLSFDKWYKFQEILKKATLAVVSRSGGDMAKLKEKAEKLSQYGEILISEAEPFIASSTEIREKIKKNSDLTCYLEKNVVQYIKLKGLYCHNN